MSERMIAECYPVTMFIAEELAARGIPLASFLDVTGISNDRWQSLATGDARLLLTECSRIAGALGVSAEFICNLNVSYRKWKDRVRA